MVQTARAREIAGELVVELRGQTYVASRSQPGHWWWATYDDCECPLARFGHKYCRHQKAVSAWNRERARENSAA
jgi:hypothetical protein